MADAGAAEEYEKAEELQAAVEAKQAELSQSQAALKLVNRELNRLLLHDLCTPHTGARHLAP